MVEKGLLLHNYQLVCKNINSEIKMAKENSVKKPTDKDKMDMLIDFGRSIVVLLKCLLAVCVFGRTNVYVIFCSG